MATPAPQSTHQSYTAGDCRLEVTSQLSALSKWSGRPIVQALTFELWLDNAADSAAGTSPIAQGDREALQAISAYIQNKTRSLLTVAALSTGSRPSEADLQPPEGLQQPLTYLQLCDLNTVLSQHEQSVQTLPIALETTQELETAQETALPQNVVSLDTARARSTAVRRPNRQRKNRLVWASSAAAALFAIGLTSTLWSRDSSLQNALIESAVPEAQTDSAVSESEPFLDQSTGTTQKTESEGTAEDSTDISERATASRPTTEQTQREQTQREQKTQANLPRDARGGYGAAPSSGNGAPSATARQSQPSPEPSSAASAQQRESTTPANNGTAAGTASEGTERSSNSISSSLPTGTTPTAPVPAPSADSTADADVAEPDAEPATNSEAEVTQRTVEGIQTRPPQAESELFDLPSSARQPANDEPTAGGATAPAGALRVPATARQSSRARLEALPQEDAIAGTISQVQSYFQTRWQANEAGPLNYQIQLSTEGDVVSFAALDEASQNYRDRILPTEAPPTFPRPSSAIDSTAEDTDTAPQNLTLRVILTRDGQVQVSEF